MNYVVACVSCMLLDGAIARGGERDDRNEDNAWSIILSCLAQIGVGGVASYEFLVVS